MGRVADLRRKVLKVERLDFYALDLRQWDEPRLPRMRLKIDFRAGDETDIVRMAGDKNLDIGGRSELYLRKMRMGHRLLLGIQEEEVLFYLWVVSGEKILMNKVLLLEPNEIAIERAFTRKDVRGHGLLVYGLNYLFAMEKAAGTERCLTEVGTGNKPMIVTLRKYGFERLDSYYYWIAHPLRHHAIILGSLRKRSRPNTLISPMAGAQSRLLDRGRGR
jgi:hypothetical protein